jgi:hypothetical protein
MKVGLQIHPKKFNCIAVMRNGVQYRRIIHDGQGELTVFAPIDQSERPVHTVYERNVPRLDHDFRQDEVPN